MHIHGNVLFNIISSWLKVQKVDPGTDQPISTAAQPLNCNLQFDLVVGKGDEDGPQK